jgi:glycine/D-amino acid oxidase-like deaminating enzyme
MTKTFDAVIVGAGIVGAACAMEFARDGMNLAIVEKNEIGGGATAAAMGHVVVLDDSPAQLALTRYSQLLWQKMAGELPREAEYAQPGTLWVAADDEEMQEVWRKDRIYREQGIPCQVLEGPALARIEPALRGGLAGALAVAEDAVVLSQAAAQFFLQQALTAKGTLYRETVTTMGSGKVLLSSGEELHAPVLVNAAGEWAAELTAGLPVVKRKGHLAMSGRFPGVLRHQVVELGYLKSAHSSTLDSVAFNVQPRSTGQLLIGSSRQYGVESREVDEEILGRMLRRATEYLPGLASVPIERTWTGFRAATPDKLPLIGPLAEDATVFAATGHEGLGITTSLATARLLADLSPADERQFRSSPICRRAAWEKREAEDAMEGRNSCDDHRI